MLDTISTKKEILHYLKWWSMDGRKTKQNKTKQMRWDPGPPRVKSGGHSYCCDFGKLLLNTTTMKTVREDKITHCVIGRFHCYTDSRCHAKFSSHRALFNNFDPSGPRGPACVTQGGGAGKARFNVATPTYEARTRPLHVQHTYYHIIFKQNPFNIISRGVQGCTSTDCRLK